MCARYNSITKGPWLDLFLRGILWVSAELSDVPDEIFPKRRGMVVRVRDGEPGVDVMTWTLVPFWSRTGNPADHAANFNARGETIDTTGSFRAPFRTRRCLIPAAAFTEFPQLAGKKIRHTVTSFDGSPILFAGIWDRWTAPDRSTELLSYTMITTEPHPDLRWIHHRLPVILDAAAQERWLDPDTPADAAKALLVSPSPEMLRIEPY